MAQIEVTPEQKKELNSKGYVVKPAYDVLTNRRHYWDPRKDENGHVMGWTRPLPGDSVRMTYYLRKGLKLEDPDGNMAPPPGYFLRRTPPMSTPKEIQENGKGDNKLTELLCPICQKSFPDTDKLIQHMEHHRSAKAISKSKKKARKPKRNNKEGE